MSDQNPSSSQNSDISAQLPPPSGDSEKADRYLTQLIELINADKLLVSHTDLSKFDPTSLQNHYRLDLKNYEVEVSHNKQPDSGEDFYVLLFNNLKLVNEKCTEKVILAYLHITGDKFAKFKTVADDQIERKRKEAEEKRFNEAMTPIDRALLELASNPQPAEEEKDDQHASVDSTTQFNNNPPVFTEPDSAFIASS
ncbi:MAG: hypothetical protein Q7R82_01775 [Candidatus Daviesbacteria bacterium]|nr:hypothetical protein [Candidatus Daviesbacteria bacterium]